MNMKNLCKPFLYFTIISLCYFSLILITIFTNTEQNIITTLLFSVIFILSGFTNFYFLHSNYEKLCSYTSKKKIISAIISFVVIDIFARLVKSHLLKGIYLSLSLSFCALIFSFMLILLSALSKSKYQSLSKILYYIGIIYLFIANIMAIINFFYPFV